MSELRVADALNERAVPRAVFLATSSGVARVLPSRCVRPLGLFICRSAMVCARARFASTLLDAPEDVLVPVEPGRSNEHSNVSMEADSSERKADSMSPQCHQRPLRRHRLEWSV